MVKQALPPLPYFFELFDTWPELVSVIVQVRSNEPSFCTHIILPCTSCGGVGRGVGRGMLNLRRRSSKKGPSLADRSLPPSEFEPRPRDAPAWSSSTRSASVSASSSSSDSAGRAPPPGPPRAAAAAHDGA